MKQWHGYNLLDLFLVTTGFVTILVLSIVFNTVWYVAINTLLGVFCVFTQAKGKIITQFIGIINSGIYVFICYTQKLYGESLLYLIVMLPLYIYGAINWLIHRDKKDNVVLVTSNLSWKEWLVSSICFVGIAVGVYFVLKALNTAQLWISTFAFVSMLPAVYLLVRRCKWNQIGFLINDLIASFLWLSLILKGDHSFISMYTYYMFQIICDIYGLAVWFKLEKKQNPPLENK